MKRRGMFFSIFLFIIGFVPVTGQNFWESTAGPYSGLVRGITVTSNSDIFAAAFEGVFRSTDNAEHWFPADSGITNFDVTCLVSDGQDRLYLGARYYLNTFGGVFISTNFGGHWEKTLENSVYSLVVDSAGWIYAGTWEGVYLSTDQGVSWEQTNLDTGQIVALAVNSENMVFAGDTSGVYRSSDEGRHWTPVNYGLYNKHVHSLATGDSGIVYAGTEGGVYYSTNNGDTWSLLGLPGDTITSIALSTGDNIFVGTSDGNLFYSDDNGDSWSLLHTFPGEIFTLTFDVSSKILVGSKGMYRDGTSLTDWEIIGVPTTQVETLVRTFGDTIFAGTLHEGIFYTPDYGEHWNHTPVDGESIFSMMVTPLNEIFAGGENVLYHSTDLGVSWKGNLFPGTILSFLLSQDGTLFAATGGNGVFRSTDGGQTWIASNNGLTNFYVRTLAINSMGYLYAGTGGDGIFRSTDNGAHWSPVNNGLTNPFVWSIGIDNEDVVFVGTNGDVYRSYDNGDSWEWINNGIGFLGASDIAFGDPQEVFLATSDGVYHSTDHGDSWELLNSGLLHRMTRTFARTGDDILFVGTKGGGVFRSTERVTSIVEQSPMAIVFNLYQNYPNPFNLNTRISFYLPFATKIALEIFDGTGRKIRTLLNGNFHAGLHEVLWEGRNDSGSTVSSGVYFYSLKTTNRSWVRKMVLLK